MAHLHANRGRRTAQKNEMQDSDETSKTSPIERLCPVSGSDRYTSLDTLRGIAVLGILVMKI